MPEQPQPVPFIDQLRGREFKPGDVIPVKSIDDFDVFANFVTQQLVKKHGGKFYPNDIARGPSPRTSFILLQEALQHGERIGNAKKSSIKFNGRFTNPRIIIDEPSAFDDESKMGEGATFFRDETKGKVVERFAFRVAMDLYTSAGGTYRVPAQVGCNVTVVDGGEKTVNIGETEIVFKRVHPYLYSEYLGIRELRSATQKKEIVSIAIAEAVERQNLAQNSLPGSFEGGKRR